MAATTDGAALTEQHRLDQVANQNAFLAEFIAMWALLDSARLDETSPGWVQAVLRAIRDYRARSARIALTYYGSFRRIEGPLAAPELVLPRVEVPRSLSEPIPLSGRDRRRLEPVIGRDVTVTRPEMARREPTPAGAEHRTRTRDVGGASERRRGRVDFPDLPQQERRRTVIEIPDLTFEREDRAVKVSLEVTGPVGQKSKIGRGKTERVARDESFEAAAGSASRHVLTGGRKSLLTVLDHDPVAVGWARVTDGDPCAFCAMLASRGVVYGSAAQAGFSAHDHCACTAEPAYSRSAPLPGRGQEFKDLWNEHIRGRYSGAEARRAWRRLYEQMQRDQRRTDVA